MSTSTPSIHQAITYGIKVISKPTKVVLLSGLVSGIVLPILGFSLLCLLLLPISVLISILYSSRATVKWKLWAYKSVSDIHQLQRSAELSGVLMKHSYNKLGLVVNSYERNELRQLQQKFEEDVAYTDDPAIPEEEHIYSKQSRDILFTINKKGLYIVEADKLCEWDRINNERIANLSYSKMSPRTGGSISGGSEEVLRFECDMIRYEFPMRYITMPTWKLDLLIYTYKNRHYAEQQQNNNISETALPS